MLRRIIRKIIPLTDDHIVLFCVWNWNNVFWSLNGMGEDSLATQIFIGPKALGVDNVSLFIFFC